MQSLSHWGMFEVEPFVVQSIFADDGRLVVQFMKPEFVRRYFHTNAIASETQVARGVFAK